MALIHTALGFNTYVELSGVKPQSSEADFDTASQDILFRGSEKQMRNMFQLGVENEYPGGEDYKMITSGISITQSRFGFIWATRSWMGQLSAPSGIRLVGDSSKLVSLGVDLIVKSLSYSSSTMELQLPQTIGTTTIDAGFPYNATDENQRSRTRIIYPTIARNYTGISIGFRSQPIQPPKLLLGTRPPGLPSDFNSAVQGVQGAPARALSQSNWFPDINVGIGGGGWCLRNFQTNVDHVLGDYCLSKWSATYEWVDRFSPA